VCYLNKLQNARCNGKDNIPTYLRVGIVYWGNQQVKYYLQLYIYTVPTALLHCGRLSLEQK